MSIKILSLSIQDMVCTSCENRIERSIKKLKGIKSVKSNYKKSEVIIKFDSSICSTDKIINTIKNTGYTTNTSNSNLKYSSEIFPIISMIAIAIFIVILSNNSGSFNISSALSSRVSYGILFMIGVFSSLHCVGMCGGIMLSQSITIENNSKFEKLKPSLLYNSGRLISYTILGGIVGGLGSIFSLSTSTQGFISILAGIFMVVMGVNIYGFKALRRFNICLPKFKFNISNKNRTPFIIGLINGFMPCGPLQTMQLYSLASGSIISGALSMFFFALGTIPLMLLFGSISSLLTTKGTKSLLKVSGIIVLILGISMTNRGFAILGINLIPNNIISTNNESIINSSSDNIAVINGNEQIIKVSATASGYSPKTTYIQKEIKTKLIIDGTTLTSCNNEVIFPSLNIRKKLSEGENIIEFTPTDEDINFSCWMGMRSGKIKVVDDLNSISQDNDSSSAESYEGEEMQFYGIPVSKIPTSRLIKSTEALDNEQNITITASVDSFEPIIIIARDDIPLKINFDVSNLPSMDGQYLLLDNTLSNIISNTNIVNGKATLSLSNLRIGQYPLIKDNQIFTIIEVVSESDFSSIDTEIIRNKYFY